MRGPNWGGSRRASTFEASSVSYRFAGAARAAVAGVSLEVRSGEFHGIIGPNGSGKSTLLRLLLGALEPEPGSVDYAGRPLPDWPRAELARRVGAVPQAEELAFPLRVRELVAMGRYPHLGAWRRERAQDRAAIATALERCDVAGLADRPLTTLSGGERQRVRLARALAQCPETLVLDEPTAQLDVRHEMAIFELLRALARDDGVTILLVTHNLNLAARYADRLLLLDGGSVAGRGAPADVIQGDTIARVYGWPVDVRPLDLGPDAGAPQVIPLSERTSFTTETTETTENEKK
ncbi:MAG: ABC transporter ATP-binding protein [Longimicrobiales bacterium]